MESGKANTWTRCWCDAHATESTDTLGTRLRYFYREKPITFVPQLNEPDVPTGITSSTIVGTDAEGKMIVTNTGAGEA